MEQNRLSRNILQRGGSSDVMNATGEAILTPPSPQGHFVYPYTNESQFSDAVCLFAGSGLRKGASPLLVMTESHCDPIRTQRQADGLDGAELEAHGRLLCGTTESLLGGFCVRRNHRRSSLQHHDRETNRESPGCQLKRRGSGVRRGGRFNLASENPKATQRLEELWNQLIKLHSVPLLCAYSLGGNRPDELPDALLQCHSEALA